VSFILDIVRHGEAESRSPDGDASRALTPDGIRSVERVARALEEEGFRPDRAFASPLLRAIQTARIVLDTAHSAAPLLCARALEPERDPAEVWDALAEADALRGHTLLVAHMPLVERLVEYLAGAGTGTGFQPGMLVRLECPEGLRRGTALVTMLIRPDRDQRGTAAR
jgi:phosphohistidine phosphatase